MLEGLLMAVVMFSLSASLWYISGLPWNDPAVLIGFIPGAAVLGALALVRLWDRMGPHE